MYAIDLSREIAGLSTKTRTKVVNKKVSKVFIMLTLVRFSKTRFEVEKWHYAIFNEVLRPYLRLEDLIRLDYH